MSEVTPRDREEKLLAAIAEGTTGKLPTPRNRKEKLLKEIYDNGGTGGGGVTPAQVKTILLDNTDTALNGASSNPIANKALVAALADYVKSTDLSIPTKVSELINDKKYQTDSDLVTALTPYAKSDDVTAEIIAEIAKVVADAPEDFDTLKEMSDWIAGHEDEASAMNSAISDNKTAITALQTSKADKSEIPTTVAELTDSADYAKIADVNDSISALQTGKANTSDLTAHTGDSVIHVTAENKTLWNTVSNKVNKEDGKALLADTDKTNYDDAVSKAHTHDNKSVLDGITSDKVSAMNSQIQDNKQAIDNHTLNDDVHVTPENKTNWNKVSEKLDKTGDASDVITKFTTATTRSNLTTKEKLSISFGKISKWFSDLKTVAFSGSYNDLSNKPASLPASDVSAWAKASTKPTYTKAEVGLGNVDNTADANKSVKYATSSGNATKVNNHTVKSDVPENAKFTDTIYDDTDIKAEIAKKADKTDIPTIGNGTITIKQAGTSKGTFTTNQTGNTTIELTDNNTTYSTGTASSSGLTKLYTETGTNTDGTMTQSAISSALKGKASTSVATTSANGLMSSSDKTKLNGIATGANNYTLPSSTSSVLGGVKLSDSTTVTNSTGLALPATEKNPNVSGSLAAQISQLNTDYKSDINSIYNAHHIVSDSANNAPNGFCSLAPGITNNPFDGWTHCLTYSISQGDGHIYKFQIAFSYAIDISKFAFRKKADIGWGNWLYVTGSAT